ncbi:MAG: hypothetical protein M3P18_13040, partial [Actinomycetota bacterium]|nr:hypothetical protein [Actinomycetota bacterium]
LERLTVQARASSEGLVALLRVVIRCVSVMPAVIAVERLSLGMAKDSTEADDQPRLSLQLSFAERIAAESETVALATALLDRLAGTPKAGTVPSMISESATNTAERVPRPSAVT